LQLPILGLLAAALAGGAVLAIGGSVAASAAVAGAVIAATVGALAVVLYARPAGFSRAILEATELRRSGRCAVSRQRCEELVGAARWRVGARSRARWELALVHLTDGNLDLALEQYGHLEREPLRLAIPSIHRRVPAMAALCFALRGWLDETEVALKEHRRRCGEEPTDEWLLAWSVATCRRGNAAEVTTMLERDWPGIDASGDLSRILLVVRAFAAHLADGSFEGPPDPSAIGGWVRAWAELSEWIDAGQRAARKG